MAELCLVNFFSLLCNTSCCHWAESYAAADDEDGNQEPGWANETRSYKLLKEKCQLKLVKKKITMV